ncbi:hypothetical protein Ait01nite_012860 [Actinoplanes italicus]|uniref:Uncharacterized protein DUF4129 n=1 Tax=Actinoplanes italicus TaxID=113567 RepID=A0A2T0KH07_9ACTN|nr:DUF4129 domain-containing protein [Actinoplanes italicus]PRX22719.1 uncharacterized protein DUF4129 [Actinoplanes italicus]GIE28241.1 hypothetical protein Ait01nite_012860 [Actinoplanes italicus]
MRGYDEFIGRIFDTVPPAVMLLILLAVTGLIAAGWYWWPAWVPRRWPRLRMPRLRLPRIKRRKKARHSQQPVTRAAATRGKPAEPAPAGAALSLADRLAAEGRYAEAIRERLRDTVTVLTRAGVVAPEPGTTAHEITTEAGTGRPGVAPALTSATGLFSEVWYGHRPAGRPEDDRMRDLTAEVRAGIDDGAAR